MDLETNSKSLKTSFSKTFWGELCTAPVVYTQVSCLPGFGRKTAEGRCINDLHDDEGGGYENVLCFWFQWQCKLREL